MIKYKMSCVVWKGWGGIHSVVNPIRGSHWPLHLLFVWSIWTSEGKHSFPWSVSEEHVPSGPWVVKMVTVACAGEPWLPLTLALPLSLTLISPCSHWNVKRATRRLVPIISKWSQPYSLLPFSSSSLTIFSSAVLYMHKSKSAQMQNKK